MELAKYHRLKGQLYRMEAGSCQACQKWHFPLRDECPHCNEQKIQMQQLSGKGNLYSFTAVYQESRLRQTTSLPDYIGLIKLEEGLLILSRLADIDDDTIKIDMPMEMVTRKLQEDGSEGYLVYGYKFRPCR